MKEVFKDIPGYEGFYQVSNIGRVKSLPREIIRNNNRKQTFKGKSLSNCSDGRYLYVTLYNVGLKRNFKVHKLVAMTFLNHKPNGFNSLVIDHIDFNILNNNVENLRLITQRENTSKTHIKSTSKYIGVSKDGNLWMSSAYFNRKAYYVGRFKTELEAYNAKELLLKELLKEIKELQL